LTLPYSRTVAAYLHALQALTTLMSGAFEMCMPTLETCVPNCTGKPARLFFMLEARGSPGAVRHVAALEPTSAGRRGPEA
jgi:hypothetical protein